ncbi:acetoin [Mycolicibacterium flavescens]|uniref:SDR family oxidoreductase n=1 Tax=Mycobacterium neumannii TaxID=2048551 RepID=UPI000B93B7DD|nr:SDR family oxidoreductase [Mycobacterium neumannii]VEG46400.1 acetoin [Mycolicibacterium flavescens]
MTSSTVVVGPTGELTRTLATELDTVTVAPGGELPAGITCVVIVVDFCPRPVDVAALSGDDWHRLVDDSMWRTLTALQQARSGFSGGGRIVVVVPTIGMAGAPGLVAYTTAVEGIRAMVKSAARQWASQGVGTNLVAVPLSMFSEDGATEAAHLTVAAVTGDSTLTHTVAESVKFLLRPDLDHLAGETIVADGGSVMLP